jgi:hypothetical protein
MGVEKSFLHFRNSVTTPVDLNELRQVTLRAKGEASVIGSTLNDLHFDPLLWQKHIAF